MGATEGSDASESRYEYAPAGHNASQPGTYYSSAEVAVPAPEYGYVAPESMNEEYEYGTGFNVQQDNVPVSDEAYAYYASGLIGPSSLQNERVYQDMSADDQHAAYADLSSVPLPSLSSNTKPT